MTRIGPYSRPETLAKLDGRTCEARVIKKVRDELTAHVGGKPSVTQRALIERAAWITMHLSTMDRHMMHGEAPSERDARQYLAWANTHARLMRDLGMEGPSVEPVTLAGYLAERQA